MSTIAHQKKLYQEQDLVLSFFRRVKPFPYVLSGETALSRFYFHHRFSEDLDFFCEEINFSFEKIEAVVNRLRKTGWVCELVGRTDEPGRLKAASYTIRKKHPVKLDFLEDPLSGMWGPVVRKTESGVSFRVDDLDQIYYRKFFSLLEQWHRTHEIGRIKDLVDIYCLHQNHRSIDRTILMFRRHHVPIDEEKIIMILAGLKKKEIEEGLRYLEVSLNTGALHDTLKRCSELLLKEGLSR